MTSCCSCTLPPARTCATTRNTSTSRRNGVRHRRDFSEFRNAPKVNPLVKLWILATPKGFSFTFKNKLHLRFHRSEGHNIHEITSRQLKLIKDWKIKSQLLVEPLSLLRVCAQGFPQMSDLLVTSHSCLCCVWPGEGAASLSRRSSQASTSTTHSFVNVNLRHAVTEANLGIEDSDGSKVPPGEKQHMCARTQAQGHI